MNIFSYKKFISFSIPLIVVFSNPIVAEKLLTKSEISRKANECFKDLQYKICSNLILEIEKIQLVQSVTPKYLTDIYIYFAQTRLTAISQFPKISYYILYFANL